MADGRRRRRLEGIGHPGFDSGLPVGGRLAVRFGTLLATVHDKTDKEQPRRLRELVFLGLLS